LKSDGTRAETRFRLSAKRASTFKSAGASVQLIAGSRGELISGSNAGYTMFRGNINSNSIKIIFINCNWVVTRWQWLFYTYTNMEKK